MYIYREISHPISHLIGHCNTSFPWHRILTSHPKGWKGKVHSTALAIPSRQTKFHQCHRSPAPWDRHLPAGKRRHHWVGGLWVLNERGRPKKHTLIYISRGGERKSNLFKVHPTNGKGKHSFGCGEESVKSTFLLQFETASTESNPSFPSRLVDTGNVHKAQRRKVQAVW